MQANCRDSQSDSSLLEEPASISRFQVQTVHRNDFDITRFGCFCFDPTTFVSVMQTASIVAVLCTLACFHGAQAGLGFGPCPSGPKPMTNFDIAKVSFLKHFKLRQYLNFQLTVLKNDHLSS